MRRVCPPIAVDVLRCDVGGAWSRISDGVPFVLLLCGCCAVVAGTVYPIDQLVSRITAPAGQLAYIAKAKLLASEARSAVPGPCCRRLQAHFDEQCGWQIETDAFVAFLAGVADMIPKLGELVASGSGGGDGGGGGGRMAAMKHEVAAQFDAAGAHPALLVAAVDAIDLDFIAACITAMTAVE